MKKLAILMLLALEIAVCSCGTSSPSTTVTTSTTGNWEAQLTGGTGAASQLNFVTAFTFTVNSGASVPLDITGFSFINAGACFANGVNGSTETGSATVTVSSTNQVTGGMTYTVTSQTTAGTVLTLTSANGLTGTSNGTTGTTGTLTNGVVVGTWSLSSSDTNCIGTNTSPVMGTFLMCQGAATCTVP